VVNEYGTFKVRLTPNGFSSPDTVCIIGPGVVLNLETLIGELEFIESQGIHLRSRYWISPRCHLVMPYHPLLEGIYESAKGDARTGTTRRGMGPVYADKVSYNGIRLVDLADEKIFAEKLRIQLAVKNPILETFGIQPLEAAAIIAEKMDQYAKIQPMVREYFGMLQEAISQDKEIVLEGAQAALLDNTWGTYPYCTASTTLAGGASAGLGIAPALCHRVIGVAKAYTTRVGMGPLPTELLDEDGKTLLEQGQEYGTVTGRPRRCGWFDADLVRFTGQLNGFTELALTKLDVLDRLPVIKICVGYRTPNQDPEQELAHYWQGDAHWLESCQPVYQELPGWMQPTTDIRYFQELPAEAQAYVRKIEQLVDVPVRILSVGPERDQVILVPPA
jgi:adenylosuccinate synthase